MQSSQIYKKQNIIKIMTDYINVNFHFKDLVHLGGLKIKPFFGS